MTEGSAIRYDGRVAIISGGGRGLGRAYALELAARGANVVVNDPGPGVDGTGGSGVADEVVEEIRRVGGEAIASLVPVDDPASADEVVSQAVSAFGRCDILINNAGILRDRSIPKMTSEEFEAILDVHLRGPFYLSQAAFRCMKVQRYGRIVVTASSAGLFGNFGQANYGAAKLGSVGLMHVLAIEGAKYGINANAIAPIAATRLALSGLVAGLPAGLTPDLVSPLVLYLVSEQSSVTHRIFSAGGGHFAEVFIGETSGWSTTTRATVEDVADHMEPISDRSTFSEFWDVFAELKAVFDKSGVLPTEGNG